MNINQLASKHASGEKLTKKEETYLWKKLVAKADEVFSKWIRERDKAKGCITKGTTGCKGLVQHNCHWIGRAYYSHRWDRDNCYGGCASCNTYHQEEHKVLFTIHQIKTHGQKRVDEQIRIKHKIKPTIKELQDIITQYSKK